MKVWILIILGLLFTCCNEVTTHKSDSEIFYDGNLYVVNSMSDTSLVKPLIDIAEHKVDSGVFYNEFYKNKSFDTVVAKYHSLACFCPNWEIDGQENYSYFEANGLMVKLPWNILIEGAKIKFLVDSARSFGYPKDIHLLNPDGIKGEIIRYYGYEILKPYKVWAARKFDHIDPISGDSMFEPIKLKVN